MDDLRIKSLVEQRYGNCLERSKRVFWANHLFNETPVAIHVFDCTDQLRNARFNISSYQDDLLSESYYDQINYLQWNFYLYLICDEHVYDARRKDGTSSKIERDREYCRKFVISAPELEYKLANPDLFSRSQTSEIVSTLR